MSKLLPLYIVNADYETGEWIDEPIFTNSQVLDTDWALKKDDEMMHFDIYEHFFDSVNSEMRAIKVNFIN
jgi:hypothetical protein